MANKAIGTLNLSTLQKITEMPEAIFLLNILLAADIYLNIIMGTTFFSPWSDIQKHITVGSVIGFIVSFSVYMSLFLPVLLEIYFSITSLIAYKLRRLFKDAEESGRDKRPGYIEGEQLRNYALKNNNAPAFKAYEEWKGRRNKFINFQYWLRSALFLLIVDSLCGPTSLISSLKNYINHITSFALKGAGYVILIILCIGFVYANTIAKENIEDSEYINPEEFGLNIADME